MVLDTFQNNSKWGNVPSSIRSRNWNLPQKEKQYILKCSSHISGGWCFGVNLCCPNTSSTGVIMSAFSDKNNKLFGHHGPSRIPLIHLPHRPQVYTLHWFLVILVLQIIPHSRKRGTYRNYCMSYLTVCVAWQIRICMNLHGFESVSIPENRSNNFLESFCSLVLSCLIKGPR